jgi:DNA processing protein
MNQDKKTALAWMALNSIRGLGPVRIKALVEKYGSPDAIFDGNSRAILTQWAGWYGEKTPVKEPSELLETAEKQYDDSRRLGITVLTLSDDDYPGLLREIYAPPPVLYVKGRLDSFRRHACGVVGTRKPSQYGRSAAAFLVKQLVEKQIAIISGMAHGIDTIAHQTCLDNGGTTIAVLGHGLDRVYPAANRRLSEKIAQTGALVSEFDLGTLPDSYNFPRRNRIISGLSAGVLVVEAPRHSGSLITAQFALQQNRDVFSVPGSIFSDVSDGTFDLLKSGAIPVKSAEDIVESLQAPALAGVRAPAKTQQESPVLRIALDLLSADEQKVFGCTSSEPIRIDTLSEKSGKAISTLFNILLSLELKGLIKQVSGQQFVRV